MESVEKGVFSCDQYVGMHPDVDIDFWDAYTLELRKDCTFTITNNFREIFTNSTQERKQNTVYSGTFTISKDGNSFDFQSTSIQKQGYVADSATNDKSDVASSTVKFLADGKLEITVPKIAGKAAMSGAVPSWLQHEEGHITMA